MAVVKNEKDSEKILAKQYPSNAHTKQKTDVPNTEKKEDVKSVVKGNVKKKKKPLTTKVLELFVGEDVEDVGEYVIHDIIAPGMRNIVYDMITGALSMTLFGEMARASSNIKRTGGASHVSYQDYYKNKGKKNDRRTPSRRNTSAHNFEDVEFEDRREAELVMDQLFDLLVKFNQASVADFYSLCGIRSSFTDNRYGWTNLSSMCVRRTRTGWIIELPRTEVID